MNIRQRSVAHVLSITYLLFIFYGFTDSSVFHCVSGLVLIMIMIMVMIMIIMVGANHPILNTNGTQLDVAESKAY